MNLKQLVMNHAVEKQQGGSGEPSRCPMAAKFHETMESPGFTYGLLIPGTLLILIGILILIKPEVLVWLVAGASILFGLMLLIGTLLLKKFTTSMKH
ncbi:MAG: hypothetical protein ABUK11_08265 [Mariprofundaceae bacterium]